MLRTVASPGTFGCHDRRFFHKCTEVTDKVDTHYGLWFTPPHQPFVHQREKAPRLPALAGSREARAATAFTGGRLGTPNHPRREP